MNPNIKYFFITLFAVVLFYSGMRVERWKEDSYKLAVERVVQAVNEIKAQQIAAIKVESKIINNKTIEKIKTEVLYSECQQDETMLHLTNYSLTGK